MKLKYLLVRKVKYLSAYKFISCLLLLFFLGGFILLMTPPGNKVYAETIHISRISGADRFATAVKISQSDWTTAERVILVRADDFPDAITGIPLAYKYNAPILLTNSNILNEKTGGEIKRLKAREVIILGGAGAVSETVKENLEELGVEVRRLGGRDRYETAKLIAEALGSNPDRRAVIAYGGNFPDSLTIGPYAARRGYPILLTDTDVIPAVTREALEGIEKIIVVGGTSIISTEVEKEFKEELFHPERICGNNRYGTAAEIIRRTSASMSTAYVANGQVFADALTGAVVAARKDIPLLLVQPDRVPNHTQAVIGDRRITNFIILGGINAVHNSVKNGLSPDLTPITGPTVAARSQAQRLLNEKAPAYVFLVDLYYDIAPRYNIRPDVALAQACKETGYFEFGGLVEPAQCNFCGLAATGTPSDGCTPLYGADPTKVWFEEGKHGAYFLDPAIGVEAHIQHLYAYATSYPAGLPAGKILYSPRFALVKRGTAPYVEFLGAAENPAGIGWAYPGVNYGRSIVRDYLSRMISK